MGGLFIARYLRNGNQITCAFWRVCLLAFCVVETVTSPAMRLLPRLEGKQKDCAIIAQLIQSPFLSYATIVPRGAENIAIPPDCHGAYARPGHLQSHQGY